MEKRYSEQSAEVKKQLEQLKTNGKAKEELIVIKRSRSEVKAGDIFAIQHKSGMYFYGKVLNADVKYMREDGFYVIAIFKNSSINLSLDNLKLDYEQLLIPICLDDKRCWTSGYFYTLYSGPLTQEEKKLDYGFFNPADGKYYRENNIELNYQPKVLGIYGIGSYRNIDYKIAIELIISPNLIESNNVKIDMMKEKRKSA